MSPIFSLRITPDIYTAKNSFKFMQIYHEQIQRMIKDKKLYLM